MLFARYVLISTALIASLCTQQAGAQTSAVNQTREHSASAREAADRSTDEAAIRRTVQAFIDTRESDDRAGLTALLTPEADQLVTSGNMRAGRNAVVDGSLNTTASTGGRRQISMETIRFLSSDIAIGDGPYDVVDRVSGPDRHYRTTIVFQRVDGEWRITAIRNMRPVQ
jgi:uncharacterized protein (TIGR02246 family)